MGAGVGVGGIGVAVGLGVEVGFVVAVAVGKGVSVGRGVLVGTGVAVAAGRAGAQAVMDKITMNIMYIGVNVRFCVMGISLNQHPGLNIRLAISPLTTINREF
jgi:hypothetical protein